MTEAEIHRIADIFASVGARIPVCPHVWREMQIARIKDIKIETDATGKQRVKPIDKTPKPLRGAKHRKAARIEKGLRANRKGKA